MTTGVPTYPTAPRSVVLALLTAHLARLNRWPLPDDPLALENWTPPVTEAQCPSTPIRAAVLPLLTSAEHATLARVLGRFAAGVRVRLWDSQWNPRGTMHPARDAPGWQVCPGDGCPWCEWAANPTPELLPAWHVQQWNPLLPTVIGTTAHPVLGIAPSNTHIPAADAEGSHP